MPVDSNWMKTDEILIKRYEELKQNKKFAETHPSYEKFCENINPNYKAEPPKQDPPADPKKEEGKEEGAKNDK